MNRQRPRPPRGWSGFEITVTIQSARGEHDLRVEGRRSPDIPAVTNRAPEDCSPAEGGEMEIENVWMVREGKERTLPDLLSDATEDIVIEAVYEALDQQDSDNRE